MFSFLSFSSFPFAILKKREITRVEEEGNASVREVIKLKFILSVRFRFSFARCTATTTVYAPPTASARVFDTNLIIFIATRQNLSGLYRSRAAGPKLVREEKPISFPLDQLSLFSLSLLARIPLWKRSRSTRLFEEVRYHSIGKFQYGGLRNFRFTSFHKEEVDAAAIYAASL